MKVKVGTKVYTDFGCGPIVAMSKDWCIVKREGKTDEEVAVTWDAVSIMCEPDGVASSIDEQEVPEE